MYSVANSWVEVTGELNDNFFNIIANLVSLNISSMSAPVPQLNERFMLLKTISLVFFWRSQWKFQKLIQPLFLLNFFRNLPLSLSYIYVKTIVIVSLTKHLLIQSQYIIAIWCFNFLNNNKNCVHCNLGRQTVAFLSENLTFEHFWKKKI